MLYGRESEILALSRLLAGARAGRSGVLVLRGEPGIGKTALLEHAAAQCDGFHVVRLTGVRPESDLAFAGLHLLLRPLLDRLGALPEPQRQALSGALGLGPAAGTDRLLVGLATLSVLAEAADDRPVLCVVDDAQWVDRASLDALAFAARRLDAEPVAFVVATRGDVEFAGQPEVRLGGLDASAAAALLRDVGNAGGSGALTPVLRYRVLAEARGNPLALIELPAALHEAAGPGDGGPEALPLTGRLQAAFAGQVDHLPEATRTLLAIAAADDRLADVLAAGARLSAGAPDLLLAERAGLVAVDERTVTFRHPLIREAVYRRAPVGLRLAVHTALADVLTREVDADRRAWHRASATVGADERVALELERAARRAAERRGSAAAATAYERAAELSAATADRVRRLALAAEAAAEAGNLHQAERLAGEAGRDTADPGMLARLAHVRATIGFSRGQYAEAYRLFMSAVDLAPDRAPRTLLQALQTAWYLGDDALADVRRRLHDVAPQAGPEIRPIAELLLGVLTRLFGPGRDMPVPLVEVEAGGVAIRDLALACGAPLMVGADAFALRQTIRINAACRAGGSIGVLPMLQYFQAQAELFHHGRHRDAAATAADALRTAEDVGQDQWVVLLKGFLAYLAAIDGDEDRCRALGADVARGGAVPMSGAHWVDWADAMLDLGQGRVEAAFTRLDGLTRGPGWYHVSAMRCIPDLVEAAVRLDRQDRVHGAFARYERWARASGEVALHALADRCRALLSTGPDAEELYLSALRTDQPFDRARTRLLYGEWLRRARRRSAAAVHLSEALQTLDRGDARPWAARARTELDATGTTAPPPGDGPRPRLTPQELQIARLAAAGLSNKDIAAQLILSPRTVGHHLYKAYPKLGVTSRSELAAIDLE
jgi:DNA-binding CsgD family transcriptional regulator/tetratricopeptide (TPR) repeat protein